ncbi:GCN5-related N-acetyltransferase [Nitrosococcus halophilus Nc 4]|uniref:GCN5-related N-acetyltransferase n=1 Tax=Nitrosococcus halophilus (strain Nc4) TaxID=472759 RepID=D5BYU8_NITHN|nr:GNAT family N-acetyltransferase [Nitrosococcus halophilus]ADE14161.1 GCN5-related N-acetyltransferase [Nitrosococcus halophilus Nc 4]
MSDNIPELILRPIKPEDKPSGFSLGSEEAAPLKAFLRKDAKVYHSENISKTFVLVEAIPQPRIKGYLTLVCSEISHEGCIELQECPQASKYNYPAIKLARLAIHKDIQGAGYGRGMIDWCIAHVTENIMPHTGCRFLVVDSKPSAVKFYERSGFTILDTSGNRSSPSPVMYIDLHKVKSSI